MTPHPAPDPSSSPADSPLLAVLSAYEADGFTGQFDARDDGTLRCLTCGRDLDPSEGRAGDPYRLEGASDPADMLAVVPMRCPSCRTSGVLVATYGPEATLADAEVLRRLEPGRAGS